MKKPETHPSSDKSAQGDKPRRDPVPGAAIESRPITAPTAGSSLPAEPKPAIESRLVGDGQGPAAAMPRPRASAANAAAGGSAPTAAASAPVAPSGPDSAGISADPASASSAHSPAARVVEVRRGGFAPLVLGGVIAAGLGAAATYWAIPHLPAALRPAAGEAVAPVLSEDALRSAAVEAARAEIQAQADAFSTRAAQAGADAARQALADSASSASADGEALKSLQDKLAALEKSVTELAARPPAVVSGDEGAALQGVLNEFSQRLAAQQARIDELAARPAADAASADEARAFAQQAQDLQAQIARAAEEAQQRIAAAEAQAEALKQTAEAADRRARAAAAAAALQAAIENGGARDQALTDLRQAGVEVPDALAGDVPTLAQLRADFPAAARAALAATRKAAPDQGGIAGTIGNFLRVQTGARSVEPREGSDPDAVLSRADAAVNAGDVAGALSEIATLPEVGRTAMADWTARATTWVEAQAALATLAAGTQ